MDELELKEKTVTCHTPNCGNGEQGIRILVPVVNPTVFCGGCGQTITDIVD
jgi:hypothetical protein